MFSEASSCVKETNALSNLPDAPRTQTQARTSTYKTQIRRQLIERISEEMIEQLNDTRCKAENACVRTVVVRELKKLRLDPTKTIVEDLADICESKIDTNGYALSSVSG